MTHIASAPQRQDGEHANCLRNILVPAYPDDIDIGTLIAEERHRAGLTQVQLAARSETSQAAIARYESNTVSPAVATLERVLRATGAALRVSSDPPLRLI